MIGLVLYTISFVFISYLCIVRLVYFASKPKEMVGCNIQNDDKWDPVKWISFAKGKVIQFIIPEHEFEQLVAKRYYNKGCRDCLKKGCCVNCGCETYPKMLDWKAACASGYWSQFMDKEKWESWKELFDIEVKIVKK